MKFLNGFGYLDPQKIRKEKRREIWREIGGAVLFFAMLGVIIFLASFI